MTKSNFIFFLLVSFGNLFSQELILDNGIYVEKRNCSDTSKHKYSKDNISYKVGKVFIYDYWFIDKKGAKKKFILTENQSSIENPLNLTEDENPVDSAIDKIKMEIHDDLKMFTDFDSTYNQTVFSYSYLKKNGKTKDTICLWFNAKNPKRKMQCGDEATGIFDNKKNLWIHPPRTYTFKILQLNPFPFYYLDETVRHWSWSLETGGFYLDPRWINQKASINIRFEYDRKKDETIQTPLGKMTCKVTEATGTCELEKGILKTHLKSYYEPKYGFVRLEYENVDATKIVMQLVEVKN